MADARDLARLDEVVSYLYSGTPSTQVPSTDNFILARSIAVASRCIERVCGRQRNDISFFVAQNWTETRNGTGQNQMRVRVRPLISVNSVTINGTPVPSAQGSPTLSGYVWDPMTGMISIRAGYYSLRGGYGFAAGFQNVVFNYTAGYNTRGMESVAMLPDWTASTDFAQWSQINHVANNIVYTALTGGVSGATMPDFPTTFGAVALDGPTTSSGVATASQAGQLVTISTSTPHGLVGNQGITVAGVSPGYNGRFTVATVPSTTSFTYLAGATNLASLGAGGTVTIAPITWLAESQSYPLVAGAIRNQEDLEMACCQQAALVYKQRGRIADTGYGIGNDHVSYFMGQMSQTTKLLLSSYIDYASALIGGETIPSP